jgi:hypothetical protein
MNDSHNTFISIEKLQGLIYFLFSLKSIQNNDEYLLGEVVLLKLTDKILIFK